MNDTPVPPVTVEKNRQTLAEGWSPDARMMWLVAKAMIKELDPHVESTGEPFDEVRRQLAKFHEWGWLSAHAEIDPPDDDEEKMTMGEHIEFQFLAQWLENIDNEMLDGALDRLE